MNSELPDVQPGFRKGRGTRDQHLLDHQKSKRVPEKHLLLLYWLQQSLRLCGSQQTVEILKRWDYHLTCLLRNLYEVKKQQLELDMEQQTGSKSGKEYVKAVYCHSAYLTAMQSTSYEMPGWMKHKLESRLPGEISATQIQRWQHLYSKKRRRTKESLDESERGEQKFWLKTQHSEN